MERSEPHFVPEWLRNNGGGTGAGNAGHHLGASDGPLLASPKSRNVKSFGNSNGSHSSFVVRSSCNYSRKSSVSNGYNRQDKNSHGRSYSGSTRNHWYKVRERMDIDDNWDSEYCDSLSNIISGRIHKDTLRRSQSMISRRLSDLPHCTAFTDLKNNSHNINNGENGSIAIATGSTGTQKVSFGRDFPVLGSDERPTTPDMSKVSSLRIGKGVQGLPIGNSSLMHSEGWTSALVEPPSGSGSSSVSSPLALDPFPSVAAVAPPAPASVSSVGGMSNGHEKSGLSALAPARPQNATLQSVLSQRFEELPSVGAKRLIPMIPSVPKTLVLNPSDKLKPKTAIKTNEVCGPKNGLHRISSLQLGTQPVHGGSVRSDATKSCSTAKILVFKPAQENGHSTSQIAAAVPCVFGNGHSTCASSVASVPSKVSNNMKLVEKKSSQSLLQSRNDFFNLVRKKSMSKRIVPSNSGNQSSDGQEEIANDPSTPGEGGGEVKKCNNGVCELADSLSNNLASNLCEDEIIHPNEEEEAFLRSLGWEDSAADEGGLTEEEINAFVHKLKIMTPSDHMKWKPGSKLYQGSQLEISTQSETRASSSVGSCCELRSADF